MRSQLKNLLKTCLRKDRAEGWISLFIELLCLLLTIGVYKKIMIFMKVYWQLPTFIGTYKQLSQTFFYFH